MGQSVLNPIGNNRNHQDVQSDIDVLRKLLAADVKEHPGKRKFRELFSFIQEMLGEKKSVASIARSLKAVGVNVSPATLAKWIAEEMEMRKNRSLVQETLQRGG